MERREMTGWIVVGILILLLIGGGIYFHSQLSDRDATDQKIADLKTANSILAKEKIENVKKITELEKTKKSLTTANGALANQVAGLVGDYKKVKNSEIYFARVYRGGLAENEKLSKGNEALRKEINRLKSENEQFTADNKPLQAQYDKLLIEKTGIEEEKKNAIKSISNLVEELANTKIEKEALQNQLNVAQKALEAAEKRLADSEKSVDKSPPEDRVKENLCLKSEIKFLYSIILVATSPTEKNLSAESRQKATNLMVRMTYQPVSSIRYNVAKTVMQEMPKDGVESIELMRKSWEGWSKSSEDSK